MGQHFTCLPSKGSNNGPNKCCSILIRQLQRQQQIGSNTNTALKCEVYAVHNSSIRSMYIWGWCSHPLFSDLSVSLSLSYSVPPLPPLRCPTRRATWPLTRPRASSRPRPRAAAPAASPPGPSPPGPSRPPPRTSTPATPATRAERRSNAPHMRNAHT